MFRLPDFYFDRISFWLGFILATLVWWIFSRIRPLLPGIMAQIRQQLVQMQQRNLMGVEEALRRETLLRAQRQHVAAPLFSLDEILIPPRIIAPPPPRNHNGDEHAISIAGQIIPYLPDWPELSAPLGVPTLTLAEALENGSNLAIIGQPGMGKTVALASLASQIARSHIDAGRLANALPLLVHVLDLDPALEETQDPLNNLLKVAQQQVGAVHQGQMLRLFQLTLRDKNRQILLLLDGLDEVLPDRFAATVQYLEVLLKKYPRIQVVAAAPTDYLDGLAKAGFQPLGIAAWNLTQRHAFTSKWSQLWVEQLLPEVKRQYPASEITPLLMDSWLEGETQFFTPLEWVLRVWGAYSGDMSGCNTMTLVDGHMSRFLPGAHFMPALEELAHAMLFKPGISMSYNEMEKLLSGFKPAQAPAAATTQQVESSEGEPGEKKARKKTRRDLISSQGDQIIDGMIRGGILVEHSGGQMRFTSPLFLGYLAGLRISDEEATSLVENMDWVIHQQALMFAAACSESPSWVAPLLRDPQVPLCRNLLRVARWLREAPSNADWRSYLMRTMVSLIQLESVPAAIRAKMIGAFYASNDPSTTKLFKQLMGAKTPMLRRLALIGAGALGNPQMIDDILATLGDEDENVRHAACLALAAIPGEAALSAVVEILLQGDETMRQAAAEALSHNTQQGHKVLEEAVTVEDLLTRRASVFGLLQVKEAWARKALEQLAVEDGQWVVRNAAAQALETLQAPNPLIPTPLPPADEAAWLLTFASKLGMGISPDRPATEVLLLALKSGSPDEQITALQYLREDAHEGVVREIYNALYGSQEDLHDPALQTLWWLEVSGHKLPSPVQFGLS